MRKRHYFVGVVLAFLLVPHLAHAQTFFTARLTTAQETHDVTSDATGTAALALTADGVRFFLSVDGLSGALAAAHFHNAAAGVNGPIVRTITDDFDGNTASGLWTASDAEPLTDALIQDLLAGNLYFNIHTAANPPGELRGQIYPSSGAGLTAALTAAQETHEVDSDATGTASVQATDAGVLFFVTVDGLSGDIAAAHFHNGPAGENGPVVRTITDDFSGNTAFGLWTANDAEPLTDSLFQDLLTGNLYFNIHTAANPPGEVRGQIRVGGGWGFAAMLDADQETHDVTSDAMGTATMTLTDAGLVFNVTVEGLSGAIAAAHFHNGPAGENGPVVRTITDDFTGNTASGLWTANDAEPLTEAMIQELLAGNLYLNIHTAANPPGEIRGQVLSSDGASLAASLTAAQQTHEVDSDATGTASVQIVGDDVLFFLSLDGLSGDIAAAHFHNGPAGENGPVVRTITDDFSGNTALGLWTASDGEPLTEALIRDLLTGNMYFNIHTADNPPGEIRGQIHVSEGASLRAWLTNAQVTRNQTQGASGTAAMTLTEAGLIYHVTVEGLTGAVVGAQFQEAPAGEDGSIRHLVTDDFDGNTAWGVWRPSSHLPFDAADVQALLTSNMYLNVSTVLRPFGELRGQVELAGGMGCPPVQLDPGQETHEVVSDARGTGAVTLTNAGAVFDLTVEGLSGDIAAAHFHNAPAGMNGPVVRTITDDFTGNTASGLWTASDAEPLTVALVNDLLAGAMYFNIHTAANPPGELRGQIRPDGGVSTAVEHVDDQVPEVFTLSQNYPNPFNPVTTIEFSLTQSTRAVLTVYNVLGQAVATLVDGPMAVGQYRVPFDASGLSTGVYYYRIEAGGQVRTQKMVLLK